MSERLLEAQRRGLWRPRLNSSHPMLTELAGENGKLGDSAIMAERARAD
jgi:cobalamin biosynthesis Mg chelatase CobN